jgi:Flp pilus assembly protein TadD
MTCCSYHSVRLPASVALLVLLAFSTTGCNITQSKETTGTLGISSAPRSDTNWRRSAENWGDRFRANPGDPEAAINYAQALRGMGQRAQAAAVLEQASIQNPT